MPPLLVGAGLLFWGWQTDLLPYAILFASILEGARWIPWRWDFSDQEVNRLVDLNSLILVGLFVYQVIVYYPYGIMMVLRWLPAVLFLLLAAQTYSIREALRLSAFSLSMRRAVARGLQDDRSIDFAYPYFALCLLSASTGEAHRPGFYPGLFLLLAWILWYHRPRHYPVIFWVLPVAAAGILGLWGNQGLFRLRATLEPLLIDLVWGWRTQDPYRSQTALGHLGELKQSRSHRILLWVTPEDRKGFPRLLHEASYQIFRENTWYARQTSFAEVRPQGPSDRWSLYPADPPGKRLTIASYLRRGQGLLAVPNGTFRLENLIVGELRRSPLGVLKVMSGPGFLEYQALYAPETASLPLPPTDWDREVPSRYTPLLQHTLQELDLSEATPNKVLARLKPWFQDHFRYSLAGRAPQDLTTSPLEQFLVESRSGHCEHFATAAVLLLRTAGIPARYATGYSVQEYSPLAGSYVVRNQHAHAWARVYLDGRWQDFDPTPSLWTLLDAPAPWWQPDREYWSWLLQRYSRWRWRPAEERSSSQHLLWWLVPLVLLLIWRLYRKQRVARRREAGIVAAASKPGEPGRDSDYYQIEARLKASGLERAPGETPRRWIARLHQAGDIPGTKELLERVIPLHYRYRFDPAGLDPERREILRTRTREWLHRYSLPGHPEGKKRPLS